MTLEIQDPEADALARELARTTGETIPQAVIKALRERLERERRQHQPPETLVEILLRIGRECASLPLLDSRAPEEIIGYDQQGFPA